MVSLSLINEIDTYMLSFSFDNSQKFKAIRIKQFICDLISGKDVSSEKKELFANTPAECIKSSDSMSDAEMLIAVLQSCDEETLISLEKEFGEQSAVTRIIRKQIRSILDTDSKSENSITTIENMLRESEKAGNVLYSTIVKYMSEKGYESDAKFYREISMSRQNFARIRNDSKNLGKFIVLWVIVGLRLNYNQAKEVLNIAGYTFKKNDKRDVILEYIIKNVKNYDINLVNEILYHFGLPTFFDK